MQKTHQLTAHGRLLIGCCISINNLPYEKVGKNEPVCIADEVPFEIPDNWEWVRMGTLFQVNPRNQLPDDLDVGFMPMTLLSDGFSNHHSYEVRKWKNVKSGFTHFANGDIVIAKITPCFQNRKSAVICNLPNGYGAGTTELHVLRDTTRLLFMRYFLLICKTHRFITEGVKNFSGTAGQQRIGKDYISNCFVALPPLEEQKRIVSRWNDLELLLDNYESAYITISELQSSFPDALKKSILQYAVQGKLVPQDPSDEPASVLLERIRVEKEQLIKAGKIKRDKHESVIVRRDNSYYEKVDGIERCIDDEIPFDVPENWAWCRLDNLCKSIADGDHQAPPQTQSGIPFLVISNVSTGTIDFANTRFVSIQYFENLSDSRKASTGDLLFTVTGSYGIVVPVTTMADFCFQRHIALIKPLLNQEFLVSWLQTPLVYEQCSTAATGTAQKTVGLNSLKGLLIPVPPLAEQHRIIAKINEILPALTTL